MTFTSLATSPMSLPTASPMASAPPAVRHVAAVSAAPWHELGQTLPPKQTLDAWAHAAGMDWRICEAPVRFMSEQAGRVLIH